MKLVHFSFAYVIKAICLCLCFFSLYTPLLQAQKTEKSGNEAKRVMLVLDASGSMWGRVEGRPKIEVAREVTRKFIESLPADVELGLVAYGHRTKGDCKDIELLIPVGKVDREKFIKTVDSLQPKGMTPLTDAVEFAAESLRFSEQKASVILVTDGEETCDRDPCDAALKLEAMGVDFTAHVIAFDLQDKAAKSIECLARNTGGRFLKADDAASLADALFIALEAETQPAPPAPENKEEPEGEATLKVPATAVAGSQVSIEWTGPGKAGDYITFVAEGDKNAYSTNYAYTRQGSPLNVTAFIEPGKAEARYISGRSGKILARAPITFTPVEYTLKAADTAVAGSLVNIEWTGPNYRGDYITIIQKDAKDTEYARYAYAVDGSPLGVEAPLELGVAEIRYISGQGKVMARKDITITEATVTLKAADTAIAGSSVTVDWTGPNNKGDYITIVTKGTPDSQYARYQYTDRGSPSSIEAPLQTGTSEIRYVSGQNKVLARREIAITEATITLKAPDAVPAGSAVTVDWTGPNNKGDYITIVTKQTAEASYAKYQYTEHGTPLTIEAPLEVGVMEIRYVSGQNKVLARRDITTTAVSITLKAPAQADAETEISIDWTGPDNKGDYITIVPKGTRDGEYAAYSYTEHGTPAKVTTPAKPGPAEIRYMSGQGDKVLARIPLDVTDRTKEK